MYQTLRTCCVLFTVVCGGGLPGLATVAQAGSADTTINFSATLVGGSCKVAVNNPNITFDPVSSKVVIAAGEEGIDPKPFSLLFSECNGWGLTPKIKISGTAITSGIPLFRTPADTESGYSQGYGVKLTQQGESTAISDQSVITLGEKTAQLNLLNEEPLTFEARLSCGSCTPGTGLSGGNLKAAVTFQFLYE